MNDKNLIIFDTTLRFKEAEIKQIFTKMKNNKK